MAAVKGPGDSRFSTFESASSRILSLLLANGELNSRPRGRPYQLARVARHAGVAFLGLDNSSPRAVGLAVDGVHDPSEVLLTKGGNMADAKSPTRPSCKTQRAPDKAVA